MLRPLLRHALFAVLVATAAAQAPLRIGSWNIEFLGDPANHRDKLPARDDADLAKIGAFVRELGVSVLAVQEICGAAPLQAVAAAAGPYWQCVVGTTGGWDDGVTAQNLGFLFDTARVELLWCEELLDFPRTLDGVPIFHRVPITACFRDKQSGSDFRLVTVHLKASQKPDDLRKRKLEATVLRDWLVLLQNGAEEDQDIALLGDFNSTYGADPQTVLESAGTVRYLRQTQPTILHFPEPIDQIAPSVRFAEVVATSFAVHGPAADADRTAWRKTYSDHFPVTVDLHAEQDDDPAARFSRANEKFALRPGAAVPLAAARSKPAPAAARSSKAPPPQPIDQGDLVEILVQGQQPPLRGQLLAPLGDWIFVRDQDGRTHALPAGSVVRITKRIS